MNRIIALFAPLLHWFDRRPAPIRYWAFAVLALAVLAPGQGGVPPSDRDEARFAQASKQMIESGDWIDIRFQDAPRWKKPAGIYWLQAASASLAGGANAPIRAYRVPSWIGAALAGALAVWALRPLIGWPAALLAGLMMLATPLLQVEARIAKTDAMLLAATTLAMGALARLMLRGAQAGRLTWALFWGALGLGILLKGPIILIPALAAMLWVAATERSIDRLRGLKPLLGAALALLIAAPWFIAITLRSEGGFWRESLLGDMLSKVASGQEAHGAPPGTYLLSLFGTFWPWTALLPLAAMMAWRSRKVFETAFLLGWLIPCWLIFELTPTKLPHYVLPVWPALAGLCALALGEMRPQGRMRWALLALFAIPAAVLALGAAGAVPGVEGRAAWLGVLAALIAAPLLWSAGRALWEGRGQAFALWGAGGALVLCMAIFGAVIPQLERGFLAPRLAEGVRRAGCGERVALAGFAEPSAVFLLGTDTLLTNGAGAGAALAEGRVDLAWVDQRDAQTFAQTFAQAAPLGTTTGFNYSKGRAMEMTLFARPDAGCAENLGAIPTPR